MLDFEESYPLRHFKEGSPIRFDRLRIKRAPVRFGKRAPQRFVGHFRGHMPSRYKAVREGTQKKNENPKEWDDDMLFQNMFDEDIYQDGYFLTQKKNENPKEWDDDMLFKNIFDEGMYQDGYSLTKRFFNPNGKRNNDDPQHRQYFRDRLWNYVHR